MKCQGKNCGCDLELIKDNYYVNPHGKVNHFLCMSCYLALDEESRLPYISIDKNSNESTFSQVLHAMADQLNDQISFKPSITAKEILEIKISILDDIIWAMKNAPFLSSSFLEQITIIRNQYNKSL